MPRGGQGALVVKGPRTLDYRVSRSALALGSLFGVDELIDAVVAYAARPIKSVLNKLESRK